VPDRLHLRAGPLAADFDPAAGWLRRVRLGGCEVLRAVYPAVRDRYWNTVPNRLANLAVEDGPGGFRLTFDAECRAGGIDFAFRGEVTGTAAGVAYRFDGAALSTFLRNRIGLCVLHPQACSGRGCRVEHPDGSTEDARFPDEIAPHQPLHNVAVLTHEALPGVMAEVRFGGDVFETEDQRNWTDASFKTYSTPLAVPYPVEVPAGATVSQTVTLRLTGGGALTPPAQGGRGQDLPARCAVAPGGRLLDRLPRIGFGVGPTVPIRGVAALLANNLRPDHLRVEVTATDAADRLRAATAEAVTLATRLEVAVLLGDDPDADLARLAGVVREVRPPVAAWVVCRGASGVAGADDLALARRHLGGHDPAARFGVGTNGYFTQLNRARPPLGDADFVAFSVNPQVHAFDDESVVETLDGQSAVVANARRLADGRSVAVTPVTLRPRFNPNGGPAAGPDPRQAAPFAAAWALGSVRRLAEAGAASATYFETTGSRGLVSGGAESRAFHLFVALGDLAGWAVDTCRCSHPLRAEGLLFRKGDRQELLVANLTDAPLEVEVPLAPGGRVTLEPYGMARVEGGAA
jgi:hypothetical protein